MIYEPKAVGQLSIVNLGERIKIDRGEGDTVSGTLAAVQHRADTNGAWTTLKISWKYPRVDFEVELDCHIEAQLRPPATSATDG